MRHYRLGLTLSSLSLFLLPCHARLGETLEQCTERYGQPIVVVAKPPAPADTAAVFVKSGVSLNIVFKNGLAASEHLRKTNQTSFDADELNILLKAESGGMKWEEQDKFTMLREDGASADLNKDGSIDFTTNEYAHLLFDFYKKEKLKGF